MKLKVFKRGFVAQNMVLFLTLSLVYYHIELSMKESVSSLNWELFLEHLGEEKILLTLLGVAIIGTIRVSKNSRIFILSFLGYILCKMGIVLYDHFSKIMLFMNFSYIFMAYYLYIFWTNELTESFFNPKFGVSDLDLFQKFRINVELTVISTGEVFIGDLTNWSEQGCFIRLEKPIKVKKRRVELLVNFYNRKFCQNAEIVSAYGPGMGVGLVFHQSKKNNKEGLEHFNWKQFYSILYDRAYLPEYLM